MLLKGAMAYRSISLVRVKGRESLVSYWVPKNGGWNEDYIYTHTHTHTHTQGVIGGVCETSGECSLC